METLEHGGWVLATIFALSFFTWFLIIHKWLCLRTETESGMDWIESVLISLRHGNTDNAQAVCRNQPGLTARMMLAALDIFESGRGLSRKHRKQIIDRETRRLRRHLDLIAAADAALPLLGLLGTVLGMTETFGALAPQAASETNALMASGISEALITTQAGLVAAVPIVLMYGLLSSHIRRGVDEGALAMKRLEAIIGSGR